MSPEVLTKQLKAEAQRLGFDMAGATAAAAPPRIGAVEQWLADGFAGEMEYIPRRAEAYQHPRHVLDGVRSLLMLATCLSHGGARRARSRPGPHRPLCLGNRLSRRNPRAAARTGRLSSRLDAGAAVRGVVDTAPLLDREFAELAGLGWVGKNTLLLNRQLGSWFLLAALLTSETLAYDEPVTTGHCGTCRACIDACPTGAIVEPYRLDGRKCISYLTIELRDPIPPEQRGIAWPMDLRLRHLPGRLPFQSPRAADRRAGLQPRPNTNPIDLAELLRMDDADFRKRFRGSPILRAKRRGLVCQAAYTLGNGPDMKAACARRGTPRRGSGRAEACAWSLERYDCEECGRRWESCRVGRVLRVPPTF